MVGWFVAAEELQKEGKGRKAAEAEVPLGVTERDFDLQIARKE